MARKSGFVLRRGRTVRETRWLDLPFFSNVLASSTTASLSLVLTAAELALRPFTVVRLRAQMSVQSDQSAASEQYIGSVGAAVISDQAVAVGVTAVPTPATDLASDLWFMHEVIIGDFLFGDGTGFQEQPQSRAVDSKAMRRVEEGQDVGIITEAGLGGSGVIVSFVGRMLIKLH